MGHVILKYREDRERSAHTTAQQVLVLDEDVEPLLGAIQQCLEQGSVLSKNVLRLLVTLLSPPTNTKQCNKENEGPSFNQHRSNGDIASQTGGKTSSDFYPVLALQSALSAETWFNLFLSVLEDTQPQPETCGFGWATVTFSSHTQTIPLYMLNYFNPSSDLSHPEPAGRRKLPPARASMVPVAGDSAIFIVLWRQVHWL